MYLLLLLEDFSVLDDVFVLFLCLTWGTLCTPAVTKSLGEL